ncbi:MAG: hypothetical protein JNK05_01855 [Myxococcales bacterium]|nr:hypothetical protein [Myxococcales bacterium]
MSHSHTTTRVALFAALSLRSASAFAQHTPDEPEITARITAIRAALERDEAPSARWRWGWTATYATLAVGNLTRALIGHALGTPDTAAGWIAATGSTAGMLNTLIVPPRGQYAPAEFRAVLARRDLSHFQQLRAGEELFRKVAQNQDFNSSVLSVALRTVVPIAMGFLLEYGYRLSIAAILNVAGGIIVGQVTIRTTPTAAIDAWQRYAQRWPDATGGPLSRWPSGIPPLGAVHTLAIAPSPSGITVAGTF